MTRFAFALGSALVVALLGCEKAPQGTTAVPPVAAPAADSTQSAPPKAAAHKASGKIEAVDPVAGTLKINHGPVESLGWPPMTMDFSVGDKALLNNLKSGQQVEFEFIERGSNYVVTAIH